MDQPGERRRRDDARPTPGWVTALLCVGLVFVSLLLTYWAVGGHGAGDAR